VEYFHVVFTLPHALNPLAQGNPRVLYALLFQTARETLAAFGDDPRHLGGEVGGLAILHTWGQTLEQHLHLHCLVLGGALARDASRWLPAKPGFLFPVRALAAVFRGKYLAGLQQAFARGALRFAGGVAGVAEPGAFHWKDCAHGNRVKTMTLSAEEFLRRFLLHVLPAGFVRIRHFGFLANRGRTVKLARCRALLAVPPPELPPPPEPVAALLHRLTGVDITRCPVCGIGRVHVTGRLAPLRRPRAHPGGDTS
jgi:hypothetical protein